MEERGDVASSPVHRAVWAHDVAPETFDSVTPAVAPTVRAVMDASLAVVRRHREARSLYGPDGVIAPAVIEALGAAGYWGLRASPAFGGAGAPFQALAPFLTEMTVVNPWVAGMMSTQACIGPVGLLEAFGTAEQKERLLRPLATGQRLGAFAITEPGTSSDWSRIRTVARPEGDQLRISGEKLFITNAGPGRTVAVLCLTEGRYDLVLIELPAREDARFRTVRYALKAFVRLNNVGLVFDQLPVPAANVLH